MNVEWRCPECGSRGFFLPKGEPGWLPYKCRIHTDTLMKQVEEFHGPNFAYVDEDEVTTTKTGIQSPGTNPARIAPADDVVKKLLDPEAAKRVELEHLQQQYTQVTSGKQPHSQWAAKRLRKEIELEESRLNDRLEYFGLVNTYERLSGGEKPSGQWGIAVLRSRVKILEKQQEEETQDA